ncbi:hypothetical protein JCM8547_008060 [Rhodosporidiobolus lusitaniae]
MDDLLVCTPSTSTAVPQTSVRRGPAPKACSACRRRKASCKRREDGGACEGCVKRASSPPPAKRNETAKTVYGSLSPSSWTSFLALVPSGLDTRLADNEMSETLGLELLQIYGDAGNTCSDPLYPPPVPDDLALQERYEAAGKRLVDLSNEDQLTCRIVFATASRTWRSGKTATTNGKLVQQLLVNAQSRADATGVWRNPTPANAISLLLLYQLTT